MSQLDRIPIWNGLPNWNWIGIGLDGTPMFWAILIGIVGKLEFNLVLIGFQKKEFPIGLDGLARERLDWNRIGRVSIPIPIGIPGRFGIPMV